MKRTAKKRIQQALVIVIVVALVVTILSLIKKIVAYDENAISIAISAFETAGLLGSLIIATQQLADSKEIARADFLVELNRAFTENQGNIELYTALQQCLDSNCPHGEMCTEESKCELEFPKVIVSNYLTFFETVYLLIRNGVVSFEMIDDLFGYRFFLAVHSKFVQQAKLAPQPENFKNIFCLEYEWLQYREKKAKKIDSDKSVFKMRQLKHLMKTDEQKRIYSEWVKECKKY